MHYGVKKTDIERYIALKISAIHLFGMADIEGPHYTAPKISAIRYLFGSFSLLFEWATQNVRVMLVSAVYRSAV